MGVPVGLAVPVFLVNVGQGEGFRGAEGALPGHLDPDGLGFEVLKVGVHGLLKKGQACLGGEVAQGLGEFGWEGDHRFLGGAVQNPSGLEAISS